MSELVDTMRGARGIITRRSFIAGASSLGALAVLGGCSSPVAGGDDADEEMPFTVSIVRPQTLDPGAAADASSLQLVFQLFEPLTRYDYATGELAGAAAMRYDVSDDATRFTFKLRPATFHNGDAVTSADFKRAWERICDPAGELAAEENASNAARLSMVKGYGEFRQGSADGIDGIACPDDQTLVVTLSAPYADFPFVVSHPSLSPVPSAADKDESSFAWNPVGNGPYRLEKEWNPNAGTITLVAYDGYREGAPSIPEVRFSVVEDIEAGYREFITGESDVARCTVTELGAASSSLGTSQDGLTMGERGRFLSQGDLSTSYLACNLASPVTSSSLLRRALSRAIDREWLSKTVFRGGANPADGIVPPGVAGYREAAWPWMEYSATDAAADVESYREALRSAATAGSGEASASSTASAGDGEISVTLIYRSEGGHKKTMESVSKMFEAIGVTCKLEAIASSEFDSRLAAGEYDLARLDAVTDMPAMESILYPLFDSASAGKGNWSGYRSEDVDRILAEARSTVDSAERIQKLVEADDMVADAFPVIPLTFGVRGYVGSSRVGKLVIDPEGYMHLGDAELPE